MVKRQMVVDSRGHEVDADVCTYVYLEAVVGVVVVG